MQNLQNELIDLLKIQDNLVIDGQLNKNKIIELGLKVEPQLIGLLIKNPTFKKHFFTEVESVLVFDKIKFQRFVNNKSFLPDSYTAFKNKIGLAINDDTTDNFIKAKNDVVLAWPHKDCVLEGGQTKEDQKRNEIFWNETLAPDNVDRLLDTKAFTNFKKYDKDGEHKITELKGDENLILKGNNLLAISSLLKTHRGKIKLIYIDPPYFFREKKAEDSFTYNSNFRLSTWATFMRNRLEVAKELLTQDGVMFVSINEDGLAYLKVLMDEIFEMENFIEIFTWKKTDTPSNLPNKSKKATEYIICFEKNKDNIKYKGLKKESKSNDPLTKPKNSFKDILIKAGTLIVSEESNFYSKGTYGTTKYPQDLLDDLTIENYTNKNDVRFRNRFIWVQENFDSEISKGTKLFCSKKSLVLSYKKDEYEVEAPFDLIDSSMGIQTAENAGKELTNLFGKEVFKYPKSESLIKYLINIVSNKLKKGDTILDFHIGSGTTASVCHKLGLKYIGIEQLNNQIETTVERLKKVIEGEQGGISKNVNWQGGGSFVYAELLEYNQKYISQIQEAKDKKDVLTVWEEMEEKAFLSFQFNKDIFNERLDAFKTASLETMQQYLIEILDKNQLYVNFSEIEDETFAVSKEDKALNYSFYKANN